MEALWRNGEIPQLRNVSVRAACSGFKTLGQWWGWGAARKGFRSKHREHAILHAYSGSPFVVVLKKSMKSPLKGFYGHLSGSHSIF